jgi:hypothetical protein
VCLEEVKKGEGEQLAVVTKCGHFFHRVCLVRWVNGSGMATGNRCPFCSSVLCEPRERMHASELV